MRIHIRDLGTGITTQDKLQCSKNFEQEARALSCAVGSHTKERSTWVEAHNVSTVAMLLIVTLRNPVRRSSCESQEHIGKQAM